MGAPAAGRLITARLSRSSHPGISPLWGGRSVNRAATRVWALHSYNASLAIRDRLAKADPGNDLGQHDLSVAHSKLGDVLVAQGNLPAALDNYTASLVISDRLAKADPGNAGWQRDLIVSFVKLSHATGDKNYAIRALNVALAMQQRGILAPRDGWMLDDLKRRAGR